MLSIVLLSVLPAKDEHKPLHLDSQHEDESAYFPKCQYLQHLVVDCLKGFLHRQRRHDCFSNGLGWRKGGSLHKL